MRLSHLITALIVLLICPAVSHANVTPTPASDILASQCRQLENAHGPTKEFPNTFYANLVFQCATNPGTAPAGVVYKEIEQYAKGLATNDAKPGSVCEITMANGGANVVSQGPMQPLEPSAANDVVVSYNAKYACLTPKPIRATRYERTSYAGPIHSRYEPRPLMAAVPMSGGYGYYEGSSNTHVELSQEVSFIPPRPSWVERDEAYNSRHNHRHKAVFRSSKPVRHHLRAQKKTAAQVAKKSEPKAVTKVEVKTTTTTKVTPAAPTPAPSNGAVIIHGGPAPTSPLPGFVSP